MTKTIRMLLGALVVGIMVPLQPAAADACSISADPSAYIFGSDAGQMGHRPWIALNNVTKPVKVIEVKSSCRQGKVCKGKPIEFEQFGSFIRPSKALPSKTRIQITLGKRILADAVVRDTDAATSVQFPAVVSATAAMSPAGLCSPKGPRVTINLAPFDAETTRPTLLAFSQKPANGSFTGLANGYILGAETQVSLGNSFGRDAWLKDVPTSQWVQFVDDDGNAGALIDVLAKPSAPKAK